MAACAGAHAVPGACICMHALIFARVLGGYIMLAGCLCGYICLRVHDGGTLGVMPEPRTVESLGLLHWMAVCMVHG